MDGVQLRELQAATLFELTGSGRLVRPNSPDREPAPRLWLAGSADGNTVRLRDDVGDRTAAAIRDLVARERPLHGADAVPAHHDRYVALLAEERAVERVSRELSYRIEPALRYAHGVRTVASDTAAGRALRERFEADGMPAGLAELGFADAGELWPPWCLAVDGEAIVSVAITARLSERGAEVGVATAPAFRGRGFAAAAVAAWSRSPALAGRTRFYSADAGNVSSQRVAARLRLELVGPSWSIR